MNNKTLTPLLLDSGALRRKRIFAFIAIALILCFITTTVLSADSFLDKLIDSAVQELIKLLFPDTLCTNPDCPKYGIDHQEGKLYGCIGNKTNPHTWVDEKNSWDPFSMTLYDWTLEVTAYNSDLYIINIEDETEMMGFFWLQMKNVYGVLQTIGFMLVVLYAMLEVLDAISRESVNANVFIRAGIKLLIALLLISEGLNILEALVEFSNDVLNTISFGGDGGPIATEESLFNLYAPLNPLSRMGAFLMNLLLSILPFIIYMFTAYARWAEIAVRGAFAPIAMANIYQGGMNSSGMRYLKKILALCLSGAMMYLAVALKISYQNMMGAGITGLGVTGGLDTVIFELVFIAVIIKSKSWANDIVGA